MHHPSPLLDALKDVLGRRGRLVDALPVLVTELVACLPHLPSLLLGLPHPVIKPRPLFFLRAPPLRHSLLLLFHWPRGVVHQRLRAVPGVMPSHTEGRHAYRPAATDCRSLGSASPSVPRSGHRLASAVRSRVGTRGTRGGAGEIPPGASGVRIPAGAARTVDGVSRRPWCLFPRVS